MKWHDKVKNNNEACRVVRWYFSTCLRYVSIIYYHVLLMQTTTGDPWQRKLMATERYAAPVRIEYHSTVVPYSRMKAAWPRPSCTRYCVVSLQTALNKTLYKANITSVTTRTYLLTCLGKQVSRVSTQKVRRPRTNDVIGNTSQKTPLNAWQIHSSLLSTYCKKLPQFIADALKTILILCEYPVNRFWRLPSAARLLYVSSLLLVRMNRTRLVAVYGCPTSVPAKQLETTQNRRIVRMAIRD